MGYNISDVGGQTTNVGGNFEATLDLSLSNATTVSGDFNVINFFGGDAGEATGGYTFSALSNPAFGTLTFNTTTGTYTFTVDWAVVQATNADQVVSFTVTGTSGSNVDSDDVTINLLICVARGTLIETVTGPVAVEDLVPGDMVRTLDGKPEPVRWIGSRKVSGDEMDADPSLRPVRLKAGALGAGLPQRDLVVSPQHRILLQDWRAQLMFGETQVLVPAKSLRNDLTIRTDTNHDSVEYFHVLFDDHQVIYTEGIPTESFHPGAFVLRAMERAVRDELLTLFPELRGEDGYGSLVRPALKSWEARMLSRDIGRPWES